MTVRFRPYLQSSSDPEIEPWPVRLSQTPEEYRNAQTDRYYNEPEFMRRLPSRLRGTSIA